jgi:hypothetical protein
VIDLPQASGIAVSANEAYGGFFHVYATKLSTSMAAFTYSTGPNPSDWTAWTCFDSVPLPDRIAVGTFGDSWGEAFVTTRCGQVYRRQEVPFDGVTVWLPWSPFSLPAVTSSVTDVAVSAYGNGAHFVYVADRGGVFVRHQTGADPAAPYGAWQEIRGGTSNVVTAGARADGRQQVFTLSARGQAHTSLQSSPALDDGFGAWIDFGMPPGGVRLVDIEAMRAASLEVFALDASSVIWERREEAGADDLSAWKNWLGPAPPEALVALSAAGLSAATAQPVQLAGLSSSGRVYTIRRESGAWEKWRWQQ